MGNNQGYLVTEGSAVYTTILEADLTHLRSQAARCEEMTLIAEDLSVSCRSLVAILRSQFPNLCDRRVTDAEEAITRAAKILSPEAVRSSRCAHYVSWGDCFICFPEAVKEKV